MKIFIHFYRVITITAILYSNGVAAQSVKNNEPDHGLTPPTINTNPLPYYDYDKLDYGMNMGIEKTSKNKFWSLYTAGGDDPSSFLVLINSNNKGKTWSKPQLVIDAQDPSLNEKRAVQNGNLWTDPLGRLWLFFDQSMTDFDGRAGVWYTLCPNPGSAKPEWTKPVRIWHGTAKSKPIVLSTGEWILPVSLLNRGIIDKVPGTYLNSYHELDSLRMANVFVSTDQGKNWIRKSGVRFPDPSYDEHHIVERKDGTLWMTARTNNGIWQSTSSDIGMTWSSPEKYLEHISSRHFIRRLQSGNLILIKHGELNERTKLRSKLMAFLSDDEGKTWQGGLMIDERRGVSYPDGFQSDDGTIYISYDRNRATDGFILMARFTESEILNKKFNNTKSAKLIISKPEGLDKMPPPSINYLKTSR
jgi:sialidase-1